MLLNLNDPHSIVAWWRVLPERHDAFLTHKLRVSPEFGPAILAARRQISDSPELSELLRKAIQGREESLHAQHLSAHEIRHREFAMA